MRAGSAGDGALRGAGVFPERAVGGPHAVGLYKLNPVDAVALESAWFQPLNLSTEILVSKFAFKFNLYHYASGAGRGAAAAGAGAQGARRELHGVAGAHVELGAGEDSAAGAEPGARALQPEPPRGGAAGTSRIQLDP